MEETTNTSTPSKGGSNKFIMPIAIVVIIAIAAIGYYAFQSQKKGSSTGTTPVVTQAQQAQTTQAPSTQYKDGSYTATGNYVSPGGPRDVEVMVTLSGDTISDVTFTGKATDATSKRFQGEFANNFKPMVVGKNINEVSLTKVSGSSLTPKGFMDALEKIKTQAQG